VIHGEFEIKSDKVWWEAIFPTARPQHGLKASLRQSGRRAAWSRTRNSEPELFTDLSKMGFRAERMVPNPIPFVFVISFPSVKKTEANEANEGGN